MALSATAKALLNAQSLTGAIGRNKVCMPVSILCHGVVGQAHAPDGKGVHANAQGGWGRGWRVRAIALF